MTRFDWEKRPTPSGLIQIQRKQQQELQLQQLNQCNKTDQLAKERARWELSSSKKAMFIRETLDHLNTRGDSVDDDTKNNRVDNRVDNRMNSTEDYIRNEEQEKKAKREALSIQASQRRKALLQQARELQKQQQLGSN